MNITEVSVVVVNASTDGSVEMVKKLRSYSFEKVSYNL